MQADRGRVIGFFSERIQFELNARYALGLGLQTSELAASLLALASVYVVGQATAAAFIRGHTLRT